jgi:hypothetical protein
MRSWVGVLVYLAAVGIVVHVRHCKYLELLRRYPLTEFQAAVHAGVPVFYTREIGGALLISMKMANRILVAMIMSLRTVGSTLSSLKSLAIWVGSYG